MTIEQPHNLGGRDEPDQPKHVQCADPGHDRRGEGALAPRKGMAPNRTSS
jgi:hypothetical protein